MWRAAPRGWCDCWNPAAGAVPPICSNHPCRGLWPRLPLLVQGGELQGRVSRQKLASATLRGRIGRKGRCRRISVKLTSSSFSSSYSSSAVRKAEDGHDDQDDSSSQIGQIEKHQIRQKMGQHGALQATAQENETKRHSSSEREQKPINTVH